MFSLQCIDSTHCTDDSTADFTTCKTLAWSNQIKLTTHIDFHVVAAAAVTVVVVIVVSTEHTSQLCSLLFSLMISAIFENSQNLNQILRKL